VIALAAGELRRVLARRMVRVLVLLALAGIVTAAVLTFLNTEGVSDAEMARRRQAARAEVADCLAGGPVPQVEGRDGPPPGVARTENFCEFVAGGVDDPRFELTSLKGILQGTTAPLVVVAWLIGASVIGSDWQSRTITTILTWEPRRARVLLTKAFACILVASLFAVLAQALLGAALLPSAYLHGTTAGAGGKWFVSVLGVLLRGTGLVAIAAAVGFSVASIGRNTAAALGIGFAYFLVIENVVGSFLEGFRRWLVLGNAIVLVSGEDGGGEVIGRSVVVAALYLTAVGIGLLAVATLVFRRRDVA
jgi:ABC-2 type transport system permease protein